MDALLKLAGDAGVEVSAAEAALDEGAHQTAREAVDRADDALAELRRRWPDMSAAERSLVGGVAGAVRARLDAVRARIPALRPLADAVAAVDPEQEEDPEEA